LLLRYLERSLHQMAAEKKRSFDASQTTTDALRTEKKMLRQALNDAQETIERQAEQLQDLKQLLRAASEANFELQEHKVRTEAELSQLKSIEYRLQEEVEKEQIVSGALRIKVAGITMENEHLAERVKLSEEKVSLPAVIKTGDRCLVLTSWDRCIKISTLSKRKTRNFAAL
jgi:chromosome segregation ATPase